MANYASPPPPSHGRKGRLRQSYFQRKGAQTYLQAHSGAPIARTVWRSVYSLACKVSIARPLKVGKKPSNGVLRKPRYLTRQFCAMAHVRAKTMLPLIHPPQEHLSRNFVEGDDVVRNSSLQILNRHLFLFIYESALPSNTRPVEQEKSPPTPLERSCRVSS